MSGPARKRSIIAAAALVFTIVVSMALGFGHPPCSGWRDCYLWMRRAETGQSNGDWSREILLDHFAASRDKIAFSVLMPDAPAGLIVADRHAGVAQVISEPGAHFGQPYFSRDGIRLLLVRSQQGRPYRDLLSCEIATWRCDVVVRTPDSIMFPIELDANSVLYSSSPERTRPDGSRRYERYDLYLKERANEPKRLTEFGLYELGWLSLGGGKIVFGASGSPSVLSRWKPGSTEFYAMDFNVRSREIEAPTLPLVPLFEMGAPSIRPTMSPDGKLIAFLNAETVHGKYHYNMAVTTLDGRAQHYIKVEGLGLSHGAFVGRTVLFNELFKDHYRTRRVDLRDGTVEDISTLDHSPESLAKLTRIELHVNDGQKSAQRASSVPSN